MGPLVKMFSVDAPHGFCGETCMDPKKFGLYKKFEANLTVATDNHPCSVARTPSNSKVYSDYFSTVTHGVPGLLSVTLDLYAPHAMPDHSCCATPLFPSLNCAGIPGKPTSTTIAGTGPYCCPEGATEDVPCPKEAPSEPQVAEPAKPCCDRQCPEGFVKMYSTDAAHGFCGEACMEPEKFGLYQKFEANLTVAGPGDMYPCSEQYTPSNTAKYSKYFDTVTHGVPGLLAVTLDLYAPHSMPDHHCCYTPLVNSLHCEGIPGAPTELKLLGTGPYCCPKGATEESPCPSVDKPEVILV